VSYVCLCALAVNGSTAGERRAAAFRVYLETAPRPESRYASTVLLPMLQQSPVFQMVRDAAEADIVVEPTSHIPTVPPEAQPSEGPPIPPQPCYVVIRHTSVMRLPGSVQAQGATCHDAARRALRGLEAQLLRRPDPVDRSI
jgi:hypothetical protein